MRPAKPAPMMKLALLATSLQLDLAHSRLGVDEEPKRPAIKCTP
jgi:hypothetical protein